MSKVLLVEDDLFLVKMYQRKFEIEGFEVEVAHDGEEGIEKMKTFQPDIVLMDIMIPKLSGIAALDKIAQIEELKPIPVLMLTNLSSTEDASVAVGKGAIDYLIKSDLTPSEVVSKVRKVLEKKT